MFEPKACILLLCHETARSACQKAKASLLGYVTGGNEARGRSLEFHVFVRLQFFLLFFFFCA